MLTDPLVVNSSNYRKILDGVYRFEGSSADTPTDIILKNTINPDGISTYLWEYRVVKNSLTPGAKDDICRVMEQVKYPAKAFTLAEVEAYRNQLRLLTGATGILGRLLNGER